MSNLISKVSVAGTLAVLAAQIASGGVAHAASATLSMNASTNSVIQGATFSVSVIVNAGSSNITAAQSCLAYDNSKLKVINVDYTGTPLDTNTPSDASTDCAAGQVQASRYSVSTHPNGSFTLVKVTFEALGSSGTTALSYGNRSFLYDDQSSAAPPGILTGSTGSTMTLQPVPAADPGPDPGSPSTGSTGSSGSGSTGSTGSSSSDNKAGSSSSGTSGSTNTKVPAITDTGRSTKIETAQAASADVKLPLNASTDALAATNQKTPAGRTVAILIGATAAAIIAAVVMAKFLGVPGLPKRELSNATIGGMQTGPAPVVGGDVPPVTPATPQPHAPAQPSISRIPDPNIPGPSAVIQPTEPPKPDA